jgi:hypothetical protein
MKTIGYAFLERIEHEEKKLTSHHETDNKMAEEYHLLNEINKIKRRPCSALNGESHELSHVNVAWT